MMIEELAKEVPEECLEWPGGVFMSGQEAFAVETAGDIYILGMNPGGEPVRNAEGKFDNTVQKSIKESISRVESNWSAYRGDDGDWNTGLQSSVRHLLSNLRLDPGKVPTSNLVFQQSKGIGSYPGNYWHDAEICWPFHQAVVEKLKIRVILCMGKTVSWFVRLKFDAGKGAKKVSGLVGKDDRGWAGLYRSSSSDLLIVAAYHPSRNPWYMDPSNLVEKALSAKSD